MGSAGGTSARRHGSTVIFSGNSSGSQSFGSDFDARQFMHAFRDGQKGRKGAFSLLQEEDTGLS